MKTEYQKESKNSIEEIIETIEENIDELCKFLRGELELI